MQDHITHLEVHEDLIVVVSREELHHICAGSASNGVQTAIGVHINDDWHCGCVRL